jgi:hypothetical protein
MPLFGPSAFLFGFYDSLSMSRYDFIDYIVGEAATARLKASLDL